MSTNIISKVFTSIGLLVLLLTIQNCGPKVQYGRTGGFSDDGDARDYSEMGRVTVKARVADTTALSREGLSLTDIYSVAVEGIFEPNASEGWLWKSPGDLPPAGFTLSVPLYRTEVIQVRYLFMRTDSALNPVVYFGYAVISPDRNDSEIAITLTAE